VITVAPPEPAAPCSAVRIRDTTPQMPRNEGHSRLLHFPDVRDSTEFGIAGWCAQKALAHEHHCGHPRDGGAAAVVLVATVPAGNRRQVEGIERQ
jgi:hypothetical protein